MTEKIEISKTLMPSEGMNLTAKWKIVFLIILVIAFGFHFVFYFLTTKYLITSGIILIISFFLILYYCLLLIRKVFRFKFNTVNVRVTVITLAVCLVVTETVFIMSGYKSTYLEKRFKYYYTSQYSAKGQNWFHVWVSDHDLETSEFCFHRTINSLGLSDIEYPLNKTDNEYRILGLGDSFTEGDGADRDSTWLKFLANDLEKYKFKKKLFFMNAGVCGSDPFFEYMLLREKLLKYKPDLVIVAINRSDIEDIAIRGGMERFLSNGTIRYNDPPWFEPIYACLHVSRLIFHNVLKYDELFLSRDHTGIEKAREKIFQCTLFFNQLSKENHFSLLVIIQPNKNEVKDSKMALAGVVDKIRKEGNIDFLDMLEYFRTKEGIDQRNVSEYYWKFDGHHNAKGYAAFARGIEWKLKTMGIIDSLQK